VKMFVYYIPPKIHWAVLFFLAWMGIGSRMEASVSAKKHFLLKLLLIFCAATFLLLFPSCFLLRETPPFRTWTLICFLLSLTIAIAGFTTGQKQSQDKSVSWLASAAFILIIFLQSKILFEQKRITTDYAIAFDAREKNLQQAALSNTIDVIELEPLPYAGMLYTAEITSDTSHYRNRHLRDYFMLKGAVKTMPK